MHLSTPLLGALVLALTLALPAEARILDTLRALASGAIDVRECALSAASAAYATNGAERAQAAYWTWRCLYPIDPSSAEQWRTYLTKHHAATFWGRLTTVPRTEAPERRRALYAAVEHVESAGDIHAVSARGARGAMQVMPCTAAEILRAASCEAPQIVHCLHHPRCGRRVGEIYLERQLRQSQGNLIASLSAYNLGPTRTRTILSTLPRAARADPVLAIDTWPITETRRYIRRVLRTLWEGAPAHRTRVALASGRWPILRGRAHTGVALISASGSL